MNEKVDNLISLYIDGEPSDAQLAQLAAWIRRRPEHATYFLKQVLQVQMLHDQFARHSVLASEDLLERLTLLEQISKPSPLVRLPDDYDQALVADDELGSPAMPQPSGKSGPTLSFAGIRLYTGVEREATAYGFKPRYLAYAALFLAVVIFAAMQLWPKGAEEQVVEEETPPQVAQVEPEPPETPTPKPETRDPRPETRPIIATIGRTVAADWDQTVALESDMRLREGRRFTLTEGFIELNMQRGARVVLEAPCVVELIDDNRLRLDRGKLAANCPPQAVGFVVDTPRGVITDLGTAFAVEVLVNGEIQTHVFEGKVQVRGATGSTLELTRRQAARIDPSGTLAALPSSLRWRFALNVDDAHHRVRGYEIIDQFTDAEHLIGRDSYLPDQFSEAGYYTVADDQLHLIPGLRNTYSVFISGRDDLLEVGSIWAVDTQVTGELVGETTAFLVISDQPFQPGVRDDNYPGRVGASGFRLRRGMEVGNQYVIVERDGQRAPRAGAKGDPGGKLTLIVHRVTETKFAFYAGTSDGQLLGLGQFEHEALANHPTLHLGVEGYRRLQGDGTFVFQNLRRLYDLDAWVMQ